MDSGGHKAFFDAGQVLLFDKPFGWTSFQLVKKVRWLTKAKKVGHAGTLDPLATGLLVICTGTKTKEIAGIQDAEKEYTGSMILGWQTPSYDLETQPMNERSISEIGAESFEVAAVQFRGSIMQSPPLFSAIQIDGKRAYEHARKGSDMQLQARPVTISSFEVGELQGNELPFKVICSKGTYIRSLVHDFGNALGCGAYLKSLVRARIGQLKLKDAWKIEAFENYLNSSPNFQPE